MVLLSTLESKLTTMNSTTFVCWLIHSADSMEGTIEFIVKGRGSDISNDFYEPIEIPADRDAKLGIKGFSTYNNIPNIVEGRNNQLKIKVPDHDWQEFGLDTGAYELETISEQIMEWIAVTYPKLENVAENFRLVGNTATSKADFLFKADYGVDFDVEASMYDLLGFNREDKMQGIGRYPGKRIVNITNVTQLIFNCNLTRSNYINGKEMPFLYSCGINVPVGYRLGRELSDIAYKSLNTSQIAHIRIWIVDEHGSPVNLRNDNLTVTLSLKLTPRVAAVSIVQ